MPTTPRPTPSWRPARLAALLALAVLATEPIALADDATPAPKKTSSSKEPTLSDTQRIRNVESFEVVWKTIRDKHFDPKLNGLDWQAIHDELRPKVDKAATMADARAAMTEALTRLHQTHFGILPSEAVKVLDDEPSKGPGQTGLTVRVVEGKVVVTSVDEGSPAAKAGVEPGWVLTKIRGKSVAELLEAARKAYEKSGMLRAMEPLSILGRLRGPVGERISLTFLDRKDQTVALDVGLVEPSGARSKFGNLPTFYVRCQAKRVDGSVEYISLNCFFDPVSVMNTFAEAMSDARDADGLIIDLRGNPGGIGGMALGIGGWFVTESNRKLGSMITRDGTMHFSLNPRVRPYEGPLAVLVDELSMSTSEILAGGLKDLNRARIFGAKTPGAALPSRVDVLPNGDHFQYAFANYISVGGKPLEGLGVEPDTEVTLRRADLLGGHDPVLDAAVLWVHSQKKAAPATP